MKQYAYFSAAIREGAKLRPQAFGSGTGWLERESCAWRAGREAIAGFADAVGVNVVELSPYMGGEFVCPVDNCRDKRLRCGTAMLVHLNDDHKWTRERIADWLYQEEEKLGFITIDTEAHNELSLETQNEERLDAVSALT